MYVVIGHHRCDDQSIAIGVVDEVCITFPESDVVVLSLKLLCRSLVHTVNIDERHLLHLPEVALLCPTRFPIEMRSTKDRLNLAWGFCFRSIILRPGPPIVAVVLEVLAANELLYLILEGDAFLSGVADVLVVLIVFALVPFGGVTMQRVRPLEYPCLLCSHENVFPRGD